MPDFDADDAAVAAVMARGLEPPTFPDAPEPEQEQEPEPEPTLSETIEEFDPRHRQPFSGLLYVGALTGKVSVYGHQFVISTPTQTERLQMGLVVQPYQETMAAEVAYQAALVAAYLVSIDGRELPQPVLTNPKETALQDRFEWVTENIRRPVIGKLFDHCLELEEKVDKVLEAMGKASG